MRRVSSNRIFGVFSVVLVGLWMKLVVVVGSDGGIPDWHILGMDFVLVIPSVDSRMVVEENTVDSYVVSVVEMVADAYCGCNLSVCNFRL